MKVLYYIKTKEGWKQVTSDEYRKFDGEKEICAVTWRMAIAARYLVPLRWN